MKTMVPLSERFLEMKTYISGLQAEICNALEDHDTCEFSNESWSHDEGGGGLTRVIEGTTFEKGGVNTSAVYGTLGEDIASRIGTFSQPFNVCGISLVIHPLSPRIPTIHMNVRYFELKDGSAWYGGGIDLTPYYPDKEGFLQFHGVLKQACNSVIKNSYDAFKVQCDEYFTIKHRKEMRGIGGVFFDYQKENLDE